MPQFGPLRRHFKPLTVSLPGDSALNPCLKARTIPRTGQETVTDRLRHPRALLVRSRTPLHPLPNVSRLLGARISIKRDDLAGAPFGGNKSRQLEFYLGAARKQRADTVLITGAVQSNFVRTAAAAAASFGMHTVAQLEERVPHSGTTYRTSGNVLLLGILGAEIIHYPDGEDEVGADAALRDRAERLRQAGKRPYVIPLASGNPPLGALGYVRAGREIAAQAGDFDVVVVASGSGLTHAGLLAGLRSAGSRARVIGSCVRRPARRQAERVRTVLDGLGSLTDAAGTVSAGDIHVSDVALSPGYGRAGAAAFEAMRIVAREDGVMLDPVYTAKTFAVIPALLDCGDIARNSRVLFVHTGGLAAVFAYQDELDAYFRP